jgi:uncharacterized repeat protein (TIGR01451 family)
MRFDSIHLGSIYPDSILPNRLVWNVADFYGISYESSIVPTFRVDTSAHRGDPICVSVTVNPIAGDRTPANNIMSTCTEVSASYDPNYKEVYPSSNIDSTTEWLHYTIHFQNTGTDTAFNIFVIDTISPSLDLQSIQVTASSADQYMQTLPGRAVRFNFRNINLPDTLDNLLGSTGYVSFKIKPLRSISDGSDISNFGDIYFDYNEPVRTDTARSTSPAILPLNIKTYLSVPVNM